MTNMMSAAARVGLHLESGSPTTTRTLVRKKAATDNCLLLTINHDNEDDFEPQDYVDTINTSRFWQHTHPFFLWIQGLISIGSCRGWDLGAMALTYCPLRSSIRSGIRNASAISRTASPMRTYGSVRERKNNLAKQRGKSAGSRASRDFNEVHLEHRQIMIPPTNLIIFANNLKFFFPRAIPS